MRYSLIPVLLLLMTGAQAQNEPMVRIGLNQNAATVTIRSTTAFNVQQYRTRSATVTAVLCMANSKSVSICCADRDLDRIDPCAIWPSSFCIC